MYIGSGGSIVRSLEDRLLLSSSVENDRNHVLYYVFWYSGRFAFGLLLCKYRVISINGCIRLICRHVRTIRVNYQFFGFSFDPLYLDVTV